MDEFTNLKSRLLAEQVQEQLYRYILKEQVPVGAKLPNEFELGKRFGVGRSTVREAVKLLISRGILEIRRGSGTYVVGTTPSDLDPLRLRDAEDKLALALDLADVRMMLEPEIAQMAALNASQEDAARLEGLCRSVEERIRRGESYVEEDIAFHTCVAQCSGNVVVRQLVPIIDTAVMMFVNVTHGKLAAETVTAHRAVCRAVAERDPLGARAAMMMHMTCNRDLIRRILREEEIR